MKLKSFLKSIILPMADIDRYLPKDGLILDLGCGEGVIAQYLARRKKRKVIGLDANETRLPKIKSKNLEFKKMDITSIELGRFNGALLSDVLHHIKPSSQKKTIKNTYKGLKKGGVLIIKEIDTQEVLRSKLSGFWDKILYPNEKVYFQKSSDLTRVLQKNGFKVKILRPLRLFPGSITLFICTK